MYSMDGPMRNVFPNCKCQNIFKKFYLLHYYIATLHYYYITITPPPHPPPQPPTPPRLNSQPYAHLNLYKVPRFLRRPLSPSF